MLRSPRSIALPAVAAITVALSAGIAEADEVQPLARGAAAAAIAANAAHHDNPADHSWNAGSVATISLNGSSATSSSTNVAISGGTVTITGAGTYQLSGSLTNGQIVVNTAQAGIVRLIFNGVTISNTTSSAVNVIDADKVMVYLNPGTTNRLTDATIYTNTGDPNAALFSAVNLTIAGTGSLTVTGNAYDGIASKGGLVITAGTINVTAVDEAVRGKSYVVVNGGTITATSRAGDGLKSNEDGNAAMGYVLITNGALAVTAAGDTIDAHTDVIVTGGTINVRAGGGHTATLPADASAKGLKAGVLIATGGGTITADAADDALNSDVTIEIDGGTLNLATADDAVHGEKTLDVTAGTINVTNAYEGLEAMQLSISGGTVNVVSSDDGLNSAEEGLNEFQVAPNAYIRISGGSVATNGGTDGIDTNGTLTISGGTVSAQGSSTAPRGEGGLDSNGAVVFSGGTTMATALTAIAARVNASSPQRHLTYRFGARQNAGQIVHVVSGGTIRASYRAVKAFQQLAFSSPQIVRGQSYDIYTGGTVSGTGVGGLYPTGSLTGATRVGSATAG